MAKNFTVTVYFAKQQDLIEIHSMPQLKCSDTALAEFHEYHSQENEILGKVPDPIE